MANCKLLGKKILRLHIQWDFINYLYCCNRQMICINENKISSRVFLRLESKKKKKKFLRVEVFPSNTVDIDIIYKYSSMFIYLPNNNVTQPRTVTFDHVVTASNLSLILRQSRLRLGIFEVVHKKKLSLKCQQPLFYIYSIIARSATK
jgi:hypothetical protein